MPSHPPPFTVHKIGRRLFTRLRLPQRLAAEPATAGPLLLRILLVSLLGCREHCRVSQAHALREPPCLRPGPQVGVSMEAQGRYEEAATAFDRAVSLARLTASDATVLRVREGKRRPCLGRGF